jgi:hypothetical protein
MTETRAVANLPNLNIEILHKEAPEGGAEYLSITLRGTPDMGAAMALLDPFRLLGGGGPAAFDPWRAWLRLADPFGLWRQTAAALLAPPRERR